MIWHEFWKGTARYFDRFYSVSATLMVLKIGGYVSLSWTPVFVRILVAFVGGLSSDLIATLTKPAEPQTQN